MIEIGSGFGLWLCLLRYKWEQLSPRLQREEWDVRCEMRGWDTLTHARTTLVAPEPGASVSLTSHTRRLLRTRLFCWKVEISLSRTCWDKERWDDAAKCKMLTFAGLTTHVFSLPLKINTITSKLPFLYSTIWKELVKISLKWLSKFPVSP